MYELLIKDFSNYNLIFNKILELNVFDCFISNFATLKISNDIEELSLFAQKINLKTIILPYYNNTDFKLPIILIHDLIIKADKIEINFKEKIKIKDVLSISIQPIKETIKGSFYLALKILTPNCLFWTNEDTRFYPTTVTFNINKNYEQNIKNLIFFISLLNKRIIISPLLKIYLNNDIKIIRYFAQNIIDKKEFLWMKKIKILNI